MKTKQYIVIGIIMLLAGTLTSVICMAGTFTWQVDTAEPSCPVQCPKTVQLTSLTWNVSTHIPNTTDPEITSQPGRPQPHT